MRTIFLLFIPFFLSSDLVLEITRGAEKQIKLGIIQTDFTELDATQIIDVIKNDLERTGEFILIPSTEMLSIPTSPDSVIHRDWLLLDADAIIFLTTEKLDKSIDIAYSIYDIRAEKIVLKKKIYGVPDGLRQSSHYVSDGIYKHYYGIEGVSSTKLMYVAKNDDIYRLIVSDADGFNEQTLLKSTQSIISPAWSPDAKDVAYVSFENNRAQVFTQNLETGTRKLILSSKFSVSAPAWSPDRKYIAFTSTMDGNSEIYIINLDTKKIERLTENSAIDTEPAWSTDGKKIIFTSDRSGSPQIYELDLRTKLKRRITTEGSYNARGSFIDKNNIIFIHRNSTNFNIATFNLQTRQLQVLTNTEFDESPCIAPNGNVIIYATKEQGYSMLAGVNISSNVGFKLPALYGELKEPAWSPFLR
tara:strand:- start:916 stop:2166 length:1251 start_codon:yes stop_codon:yes gene_type:complete